MKTSDAFPRVLIDTNVFISYLLATERTASPIALVIELAGDERFELLLPQVLIEELKSTIEAKLYLHQRIERDDMEALVNALETLSLQPPPLTEPYPRVVRDENDNFLLAYAAAYGVDVLVTGDKDLLVLREHLDRPQIMTVREFLELLRSSS